MAESSQAALNKAILSLLKIEDKGWNTALFQDKIKITTFLCESCHLVCCDAVELGCDHADDHICSYCKNCLLQILKDNEGKCPINGHQDPITAPVRSLRRQILKSSVICPYSKQYKQMMNDNDNSQIIDTIDADEKEGSLVNINNNNNKQKGKDIDGCDFKGTLKELMEKHLSVCVKKYNSSFTQIITINALKQKIEQQESKINQQSFTIDHISQSLNESQQQNISLKTQLNEFRDLLKISNNKTKQLTNSLNESQEQIQALSKKLKLTQQKNVKLEKKISVYEQKQQEMENNTQDSWDKIYKGSTIKIIQRRVENTHNNGGKWMTVYGKIICNQGYKYKWRLKIVNISHSGNNTWKILVGVHKANSNIQTNTYFTCNGNGYAFVGSQAALTKCGSADKEYGEKYEDVDDIIEISLDLQQYTLSFTINGTNYGIAYNVDRCTYKLALSIISGRTIELL